MPDSGDVVQATDPIITQVSDEYVDENGNTVIVGYPPSVTVTYTGTAQTECEPIGLDPQPSGEPQ